MRETQHPRDAGDAARAASPGARVALVRRTGWLLPALMATCGLSLVFPGDVPWINDEPQLIASALRANAAHQLATHGLQGTIGLYYGPLPTWIYQWLLHVSHDPVILSALHAALMSSATAFALYWLARQLRLWPWFALAVAVSPYLVYYNRLLWDNSFNIPLGAIALAAYSTFVAKGSRAALAVAAAAALAMPLVHPMGLAFVLPMVLHAAIFQRRSLWRHRWVLLAILAMVPLVYGGYAGFLGSQIAGGAFNAKSRAFAPNGFAFPLLGPRFFTALALGCFYGPDWGSSPPLAAARAFSFLAFPLAWIGAVLAARRVRDVFRGRPATTLDHMVGLCLGIVVAQMLLNGVTMTWGEPHYFNATWIAFALLSWLCADTFRQVRKARLALSAYGAGLAASTIYLLGLVHARGGNRVIQYGPTLRNQVEVAERIGRYAPNTSMSTRVRPYLKFPLALATLRLLASHEAAPAAARELEIRYESADPRDGRVEVVAHE